MIQARPPALQVVLLNYMLQLSTSVQAILGWEFISSFAWIIHCLVCIAVVPTASIMDKDLPVSVLNKYRTKMILAPRSFQWKWTPNSTVRLQAVSRQVIMERAKSDPLFILHKSPLDDFSSWPQAEGCISFWDVSPRIIIAVYLGHESINGTLESFEWRALIHSISAPIVLSNLYCHLSCFSSWMGAAVLAAVMPAACACSLTALPVAQPGIVFQAKQISLKKKRKKILAYPPFFSPLPHMAVFSLAFLTNVEEGLCSVQLDTSVFNLAIRRVGGGGIFCECATSGLKSMKKYFLGLCVCTRLFVYIKGIIWIPRVV